MTRAILLFTAMISRKVRSMPKPATSLSPPCPGKAGKLRALAFAGPRRSAALPTVPTTAEAGLADFQVRAWHGVLAPAGVSPEIARKLADAVHAATREPAVQAALSKMGAEPADEVLEEFAKVIQAESVKWGEVVKRANVKVD